MPVEPWPEPLRPPAPRKALDGTRSTQENGQGQPQGCLPQATLSAWWTRCPGVMPSREKTAKTKAQKGDKGHPQASGDKQLDRQTRGGGHEMVRPERWRQQAGEA